MASIKNEVGEDVMGAPAPAPVQELTLDEFCTRLSLKDKRVELIGGFHYTERVAGKSKDTESAFEQRFAAFVTKPA